MTEIELLERLMEPPTEPGIDSADMVQQFARCLADIAGRLSQDQVECLVQAGQCVYQAALAQYLTMENVNGDGN